SLFYAVSFGVIAVATRLIWRKGNATAVTRQGRAGIAANGGVSFDRSRLGPDVRRRRLVEDLLVVFEEAVVPALRRVFLSLRGSSRDVMDELSRHLLAELRVLFREDDERVPEFINRPPHGIAASGRAEREKT